MPREPLPKDPESLERWRQLPQDTPSKQALPPAAGGSTHWLRGLLIVMTVLIILALLSQLRPA